MRYQANFAATGAFLRTSAVLRRECRRAGEEIREVAEAIAPIDEGDYIASMSVQDAVPTDRVGAILLADDPAAAPLEFGNARTGGVGRNILTRAAEIAGYDVDPARG